MSLNVKLKIWVLSFIIDSLRKNEYIYFLKWYLGHSLKVKKLMAYAYKSRISKFKKQQ